MPDDVDDKPVEPVVIIAPPIVLQAAATAEEN